MEKQYSSKDIQALTAREQVRKRPGLYFEKCFREKSLNSLPLEAACHAIDEVYDHQCNRIEFALFKDHFSVTYNAGMPMSRIDDTYKAELIMTAIFACRNHKKHLSVGEEFCELGIATINFCSEYCHLTTVSKGVKGVFQFQKGLLVNREIFHDQNQEDYTEIMMKPDREIFGNLGFDFSGVKETVDRLQGRFEAVEIIVLNLTS